MNKENVLGRIEKYVIYPALGISRVGNSKEWFYAPEVPGRPADPRVPRELSASIDEIQYKDKEGAIKKQAARFRVYGLDNEGKVVAEINSDLNDAHTKIEIEWNVRLANRKGAWYQYINPLDLNQISEENKNTKKLAIATTQRNNTYGGGVPYGLEPKRKTLVIDSGEHKISGQSKEHLSPLKGHFMNEEVVLGTLRTDNKGRLIVLGGSGEAKSAIPNNPVSHFANNNGWFDDTSDGPVRAKVRITVDGKPYFFHAEDAFVAVVPPNYGQGIYGTTTMYDIVEDVYNKKSGWETLSDQPSFEEHIWPIFKSLSDSQWVSEGLYMLFGQGSPCNFTDSKVYRKLVSIDEQHQDFKQKIFNWFRDPETTEFVPTQLPANYGDALRDFAAQPNDNLWLTKTQYFYLKEWVKGNFVAPDTDLSKTQFPLPKTAIEDPLHDSDLLIQPFMLTKAALQECLGGPFRPGIEIAWPLRVDQMWKAPKAGEVSPFRLQVVGQDKEDDPLYVTDDYGPVLSPEEAMKPYGPVHYSGPGTLTRWMGVPWQADAGDCLGAWDDSTFLPLPTLWAPRAPREVMSKESFERLEHGNLGDFQKNKHFNYRQFWLRDVDNSSEVSRLNDMIMEWSGVGIIAPKQLSEDNAGDGIPSVVWVEQQRAEHFSIWDPSYLQMKVAEGAISPEEAIEQEKDERKSYEGNIEDPECAQTVRKVHQRISY